MTRKRPVFLKEDSDEDYFDNYESDNENYDSDNARNRASKSSKTRGGKIVTKVDSDDDNTELEAETELEEDSKSIATNEFEDDSKSIDTGIDNNDLDDEDNIIVKVDKYWPYGMEVVDETVKENRNLLYLHSTRVMSGANFVACPFCEDKKSFKELSLNLKCSVEGHMDLEESSEKFPEAFAKFTEKEKVDIEETKNI